MFFLVLTAYSFGLCAQTNTFLTNPTAADILDGNYDPTNYQPQQVIDDPHLIASQLTDQIRPDSLLSYLKRMSEFGTRNTGSDTISNTRGMGAARRWGHSRFQQISQDNDNRLVVSYVEFEEDVCGMDRHRNVVGILPGNELTDGTGSQTGIIVIEGHLDSRCDDRCDVNCDAEGMEDNGSGSALVIELARVMSQYRFNRTIVFMLTTGEEQGLVGARALADYCLDNGVPVAAVLNNDVIGGITCGERSSPPSCPGENHIDSTQVRLFSNATFNSPNKQLVRYIKLQYDEELLQHVDVPMQLTVMTAEDRTGRGGDHIPFRQNGFPSMRFTSANEHGDGDPSQAGYHDRQHTSEDILGIDTDNDGNLDSFYVDFNYLARNAAINANAATMIAQNVCSDLNVSATQLTWQKVRIRATGSACNDKPYRYAIRSVDNDWDTVITSSQDSIDIDLVPGALYFFSAATTNTDSVESLFTEEFFLNILSRDEPTAGRGIELLQNRPNPFDETTAIAFIIHDMPERPVANIRIADLNGRVIEQLTAQVEKGPNEVIYDHGYGKVGTFFYSLEIDGRIIDTKKMMFVAN